MRRSPLDAMANTLVASGKGLLAMDESTATCNRRFAATGIAQTEAARQAYRTMLITAPGLGTCISGAILADETIRQRDEQGVLLVTRLRDAGIIPGVKVDRGTTDLALHPGEHITEGLDGLRDRLCEYAGLGAGFAKWRAVLSVSDGRPTKAAIEANAQALARYAALCQEAGLVPIVEPEVLMEGSHTLQRCADATQAVLDAVFAELRTQGVSFTGMILKPNMVLAGTDCPRQPNIAEITAATLDSLARCVPADVAGIAFLSGGQSDEQASCRLNALNAASRGPDAHTPWPLVFSFGRALQRQALTIWHGDAANTDAAQQALILRARRNHAALDGTYSASHDGVSPMAAAGIA